MRNIIFEETNRMYMKKTIIGSMLLAGLMASYSCNGKSRREPNKEGSAPSATAVCDEPQSVSDTMPRVKFVRQGGGNIEYVMVIQSDSIKVHVTQKQFREADFTFNIASDSTTLATLQGIVSGKISCGEADTTAKPGAMIMGGTWQYAYLIEGDGTEMPIHDKELVEIIATTEDPVRDAIEQIENEKSEE